MLGNIISCGSGKGRTLMKFGRVMHFMSGIFAGYGYLTKQDILLILAILIQGLQLLYDYLKNQKD